MITLERGGRCAEEPCGPLLRSAVSRDVQLLLRHFFAVAFFSMVPNLNAFSNTEKS